MAFRSELNFLRHLRPSQRLAWIAPMRIGSGADLPWPLPFPASAWQALRCSKAGAADLGACTLLGSWSSPSLWPTKRMSRPVGSTCACSCLCMSADTTLEAATELSLLLPHFHNLQTDNTSSLQLLRGSAKSERVGLHPNCVILRQHILICGTLVEFEGCMKNSRLSLPLLRLGQKPRAAKYVAGHPVALWL